MFNMSGSLEYAMSWLLALSGKVGIFGLTILGWIVLVAGLEWSLSLIQKIGKAIFPGATYQQEYDQQLQEMSDFWEDREQLAQKNWDRGISDPENDGWDYSEPYYN